MQPRKRYRTRILPDFSPSGLLELESNNKEGILLKHAEPRDASSPNTFYSRLPMDQRPLFKLILYKGSVLVREFDLMNKSSYVIGRSLGETIIADIPIKEETCSKQHCVIQFRAGQDLKAFLMDLESANGTTLNGDEIPPSHYVELRKGDVISSHDSQYDLVFVNS
ncbi:PML1 (YLR016C) [Zygosaccharomyces parabailii]|nr:PML1 (YLR016C) [Zygosaccharomyces parabailii]CDH10573.1 related to PML1-Subunit of the RES complex,which is required for nuclear retention of unspliced pre-mRNAs [Zygosaccharomyces bailii ISA1307]